jgi:hypothetical protein
MILNRPGSGMLSVIITISVVFNDNVIDDIEIKYQSLMVITFESKISNPQVSNFEGQS